jgi:hypothetical protein
MVHIIIWFVLVMLLCWGNMHTVMENVEPLVVASKEIGLEISADKSKCMVMSRDQVA